MEKQSNVPRLRFPGFEGEWKVNKLGNLLEFKNGINASKEQYGRGIKFINVLDILNNDIITYDKIIGSVDVDDLIAAKYPVGYGDILFQRSSETREEVGTASVYLDKDRVATFGGFVIRGKKIGDYDPVFLNKLLKTDSSRDEITSKSGGSTRYNVGQETLSSVALLFPSLPEQQKIASFLTAVDEKLQALKKKKSLLEQYKKGVMQKIFSQELRFKQDNGEEFPDWEEKKLGLQADIKSKKYNPVKDTRSYKCIELDHISPETGQILGYADSLNSGSIKNMFDKGDVLFGKLRPYLRKYLRAPFSGVCSSEIWVLKGREELSNEFLYYLIQTDFFVELVNQSTGSKMPRADWSVVSEGLFSFPSLTEQTKIANFLSAIDEKINLCGKEIEKTAEWKKGLLQGMFC
ncbi:MAG: restriction endonuclease subunit S [Dyadobacter fermentans]